MTTKAIIFTDLTELSNFPPQPALKNVPEWYKKMQSYIENKKEITDPSTIPGTIKKCIPVFDAMTAGYILYTQNDVYVKTQIDPQTQTKAPYFYWSGGAGLEFHAIEQAEKHPNVNGFPFPKWLNPYSIKTPKGYSTLFVSPLHNPNGFFTVFPGIVDTDNYSVPINFPFTMNDPTWEGLIPAGTPMVQIIPFKRDKWKNITGGIEDRKNVVKQDSLLHTKWFDKYKTLFWEHKNYD